MFVRQTSIGVSKPKEKITIFFPNIMIFIYSGEWPLKFSEHLGEKSGLLPLLFLAATSGWRGVAGEKNSCFAICQPTDVPTSFPPTYVLPSISCQPFTIFIFLLPSFWDFRLPTPFRDVFLPKTFRGTTYVSLKNTKKIDVFRRYFDIPPYRWLFEVSAYRQPSADLLKALK